MDVKTYLKQVRNLEALCYEQRRAIKYIRSSIEELKHPRYRQFEKKKETNGGMLDGGFFGAMFGIIPAAIVGVIGMFITDKLESFFPTLIVTWILIIALAAEQGGKEAQDIEEYNQGITSQNESIAKQNKALQERCQDRINKLVVQLRNAEINYQRTSSLLEMIYSWNIIHPKYRNFIAVCSLYEYFSVGRCTQLTGHEGGYNIFESELRLNVIINKLDEIIERLDDIRNNQYELYSAITESNRNLSKMNKNLQIIENQNNRIENYSEINAYNSRISAENSSIVRWMQTYEYLK